MQLYTTVITATSIITNWNNSEYVIMLSPPFVRMGTNRLPFLVAPSDNIAEVTRFDKSETKFLGSG